MKKFINYLQDQAVQASQQKYSGAAYLSPASKEPQQREHHHGPSQYKAQHTAHHQRRAEHPSTAAHSFPAHTAAGATATLPKNSNGQRDPSPPPIPEPLHRDITRHQYAFDHILQSYELYIPELDASHLSDPNAQRYWVVYIHGGYFRDPSVTSSSFYPALSQLVGPPHHHGGGGGGSDHHHPHLHLPHPFQHDADNITAYIAGYASINYRLSPHHDKAPQDPNTTSAYELRNAKWPDHIHDVLAAIAHLQQKYGFGERYLLVGHSVGATMAVLSTLASKETFTTAPTDQNNSDDANARLQLPQTEPPLVVLGVSGIYDFELLHDSFPSCVSLTRNAMPDPRDHVLASPARYPAAEYIDIWAKSGNSERVREGVGEGTEETVPSPNLLQHQKQKQIETSQTQRKPTRALILAHSRDDGLVDWTQVEAMEGVFHTTQPKAQKTGYASGNSHENDNGNSTGGSGPTFDKDQDKVEGGGDGDIAVKLIEIEGQHNDIWSQGTELARVIREGMHVLRNLDMGVME
ncbi:hypothetical protein A1O1_05242 [Capronia coronata CBS 617.96]|uniref:Arylformamidase n=1 Tax=Capronia coronata CBS 617.96 TaxID=1182541 RepID=W9Y656_9EURO|nr:uncharacterized protein A1O1_05242 [Capronia coronata CBS 617.96]EXJ88312.1 hypothetical protein A1O1_05242 [Capronia coronata CBS 617.96]